MNNYHEIQNQWDMRDQVNYPRLFEWTVNLIKDGMSKGEKVMR